MTYTESITKTITAILLAAGVGSRMQTVCPKQYLTIGQYSMVEHAIYALLRHPCIQRIIVAINLTDNQFKQLPISSDPRVSVTIGGRHRADSVMAGLHLVGEEEWVLIHDAARPCLHLDDITRLLAITEHSKVGGILAFPASDTMKRVDLQLGTIINTIDRKNLWHALTPQLFPRALLKCCLQRALCDGVTVTDEASAMEYCGYHPLLVHGRSNNIKVTRKEDLALATFYLAQSDK
ncbi:2-C-methyl-D-erythritol 4-phosphate cytidylyltransferase [Candidatus Gillettellia adelgis]